MKTIQGELNLFSYRMKLKKVSCKLHPFHNKVVGHMLLFWIKVVMLWVEVVLYVELPWIQGMSKRRRTAVISCRVIWYPANIDIDDLFYCDKEILKRWCGALWHLPACPPWFRVNKSKHATKWDGPVYSLMTNLAVIPGDYIKGCPLLGDKWRKTLWSCHK